MASEYSGGGDPARSLDLLWRSDAEPPRGRGPRPGLRLDRIVVTAVRRADAEGLAAVSMRRLADALDVGTMSLYTYIPGKAELVDLMTDAVHGELYRSAAPGDIEGWRERLALVARENWALYRRHPWLLRLDLSRPPLGPNTMAKYEHELTAVEGVGLSDVEMDGVVNLVVGHAQNCARAVADAERTQRDSGLTDEQWWQAWAPKLEKVLDTGRYPTAARVGEAVGAQFRAAYNPEHGFEFGLQRILDGIGDLIAERAAN